MTAASWADIADRVLPLTRDRYEAMIDAGILGEDEHIELLNGMLVAKMTQGVRHARAIQRLQKIFHRLAGELAEVRTQLPFGASNRSVPEPDLCLTSRDLPADRHPDRALLVVEVAETSLRDDRVVKGPIYAANGVPEFWLVDVVNQRIEVHTQPLDDHYGNVRVVRPGERLELTQLPGIVVDAAEIFA